MLLTELLKSIEYEITKGAVNDIEVDSLTYDSRKVTKGSLFVCIKGANSDGHEFAGEVADKGAAALVTERDVEISAEDTVIIRVKDTRYALACLSAAWFGNPADSLKLIGVTGTKGKTTTTYLTKAILENAGHKVGLIGTIEILWGENRIPAKNTTPESYVLQETFHDMLRDGVDTVVMEVSSQALMMHRTAGFTFDTAVFTNIEPDHIGPNEHSDFDDYLSCKAMLFRQCRFALVNGDDPHLEKLLEGCSCPVMTFGLNAENTLGGSNDLRAENEALLKIPGELGVSFDITGSHEIRGLEVGTPGEFSVYNALCAAGIALHYNADEGSIREALKSAHVKGRIEAVKVSDEFSLVIDYAHNAMALESLLKSLRKYEPGRLICVFGCGGNRAKSRRYEMGEVSGKLADLTIITSDNPRFEEPSAIIDDIESSIKKTGGEYVRIEDRKEAIAYAIRNGRKGDLIILAGKGHEDYQEIKGVKYPMDERVLIDEILGR
ncbi:MAG: UDP-N-acetylmuramoyl-L-alanyl-D-glutamate--2,6-diaminopimelate ligase [Lachnospiraceae bacterium]|nr:UDP-N-acetylmuramoyl-L-alanyl-D-glutamate--2,6-diaminopimelate ligase [Lachnospiraceae bacterium]